MPSSKKLTPSDCDNDRQPGNSDMAAKTGNSYITGTTTDSGWTENAGPENGGRENGGPEIAGPSTCAENAGIMSVISDRNAIKSKTVHT